MKLFMFESSNVQSENIQIYPLPFKVKSTTLSAFSDPFNWLMIFAAVIWASLFMVVLFFESRWYTLLFAFLQVGFSFWFLYRYIRAILNREIEIDETGFRYKEDYRRLFFSWNKIESILIEPFLGQITFFTNGKKNRIHEFGLPKQARETARYIVIQQATIRQIKVEVSIRR